MQEFDLLLHFLLEGGGVQPLASGSSPGTLTPFQRDTFCLKLLLATVSLFCFLALSFFLLVCLLAQDFKQCCSTRDQSWSQGRSQEHFLKSLVLKLSAFLVGLVFLYFFILYIFTLQTEPKFHFYFLADRS